MVNHSYYTCLIFKIIFLLQYHISHAYNYNTRNFFLRIQRIKNKKDFHGFFFNFPRGLIPGPQ